MPMPILKKRLSAQLKRGWERIWQSNIQQSNIWVKLIYYAYWSPPLIKQKQSCLTFIAVHARNVGMESHTHRIASLLKFYGKYYRGRGRYQMQFLDLPTASSNHAGGATLSWYASNKDIWLIYHFSLRDEGGVSDFWTFGCDNPMYKKCAQCIIIMGVSRIWRILSINKPSF